MSSLSLSGAMEDVKVGSGLTRSRLVVRRAEDWCRWKDSGNTPSGRRVEELDENTRLGRLVDDIRETMVFISPSSTVSSVKNRVGIQREKIMYIHSYSVLPIGYCLGSTRIYSV